MTKGRSKFSRKWIVVNGVRAARLALQVTVRLDMAAAYLYMCAVTTRRKLLCNTGEFHITSNAITFWPSSSTKNWANSRALTTIAAVMVYSCKGVSNCLWLCGGEGRLPLLGPHVPLSDPFFAPYKA